MDAKSLIKTYLNKLPYVSGLNQQIAHFNRNSRYPAGHFYSPIVLVEEVRERETEIWDKNDKEGIKGINLRTAEQLDLLEQLSKYYPDMPFKAEKQLSLRYYFENAYYSYTDAIILYAMIRHLQPKRIIEVGSGFSSAVMLDTNDLFFDKQINLTFIEPYPERLFSLLAENDQQETTVFQSPVQAVPLEIFEQLQAGDILFIDSSHVVKTGSDVYHLLFEILPVLESGVLIHFHDIFYPFEYPKDWVYKGFNWNEGYFLRAFLMCNNQFEIKLFSEYLHRFHKEAFSKMPLSYKNFGGNLWIEKSSCMNL